MPVCRGPEDLPRNGHLARCVPGRLTASRRPLQYHGFKFVDPRAPSFPMALQSLQWRVAAHSDFALNDLAEARLLHSRLQHPGVVDKLMTPCPEEIINHTRSFRKGLLR